MNSICNYNIGKVTKLNNTISEIVFEEEQVMFYISGIDNDQKEYSLEFKSTISKTDFLKLKLGERINFVDYIDKYDVVFGYDGLYDLKVEYNINITRYLSNKFLLNINFNNDSFFGKIELDFDL